MDNSFILSDSLMCMDLLNAGEQLKILDKYMDWHHADVMDGHFCPNITLSPDFVARVCAVSKIPVEAHLMVERPQDWIGVFAAAGVKMISLHAESINNNAFRLINEIRSRDCKVGVTLSPMTVFENVKHLIDEIDRLTLMTVDVGYAGQKMIPQVIGKIKEASEYKKKTGLSYEIQIDGCCNKNTYSLYASAGAEMLVMGSGLFGLSDDLENAVRIMREEQMTALKSIIS